MEGWIPSPEPIGNLAGASASLRCWTAQTGIIDS